MRRWRGLGLAVLIFLAVNLFAPRSAADAACETGQHKWYQDYCRECGEKRETFPYGDWEYAILEDGSIEIVSFEGSLGSWFGEAYSLDIPEEINGRTVTSIGANAINGYSDYELNAITIPDSVTAIGDCAFGGNPGLTEISISDNVVSLGNNPFAGLGVISLGDNPYEKIYDYSPFTNGGLTDIKISENHPTLALIDGVLFDKRDMRLIYYPSSKADTTYAIPQGIREIDAYAFFYCTALEEIEIPSSVTTIGEGAFFGCSNLKSITIPSSVAQIKGNPFARTNAEVSLAPGNTALQIRDGSLFSTADMRLISYLPGNTASSYKIPEGTREIGKLAFYARSELTQVHLPDSIAAIDEYAFTWSGLEDLNIPDGVRSIGRYAYSYCKMTSIVIPGSVVSIQAHAFDECGLQEMILQEGITKIGDYAFGSDGGSLKSIRLPASVTSLGKIAFYPRIEVAEGNPVFEVRHGALFDNIQQRLIRFYQDEAYEQYTYIVPEGTREIGAHAFSGAYNMKEVQLPDSVVSIGDYAFFFCPRLENVQLPEGIMWIGHGAFERCDALEEITLPDTVASIGSLAFFSGDELKKVNFPAELRVIGSRAFACCHNLTDIALPDKLEYISYHAFDCCPWSRNITIGANVYYIGKKAFYADYPNLDTIFNVTRDSYAAQFCEENGYTYQYTDASAVPEA